MKKYGKKWNARVYDDQIRFYPDDLIKDKGSAIPVTILEITPQMKKAVQEGSQSLFEILGFATAGGAAAATLSGNEAEANPIKAITTAAGKVVQKGIKKMKTPKKEVNAKEILAIEQKKQKAFEELASKGKTHQTKGEDLKDILSGKSQAVEFGKLEPMSDEIAHLYELGDLIPMLKKKKLFISDDGLGTVYAAKTKNLLEIIKKAETPYDFGMAYGYKEADIAHFYTNKRGGDPRFAHDEFISDKRDFLEKYKGMISDFNISEIITK
jgi:hypothetical protein